MKSGSRMRTRPSVLLGLFAFVLLALCGWLLPLPRARPSRMSEPVPGGHDARPTDCASSAPTRLATEPPQRSSLAELPTPDPLPVASSSKTRPGTLVHGSLLDSSGSEIEGSAAALVSFVDSLGRRRTSAAREAGAYGIPELEFGSYWVSARAPGYRTAQEQIELRANRPRMRLDFSLEKAVELRIRIVTPEGEDLFEVLKRTGAPAGARRLFAVATLEPPGEQLGGSAGTSDEPPSTERLAPGGPALLVLEGDLPVFVSLVHHRVVLQTQCVRSAAGEVRFVVSPAALRAGLATIRVQVVDAETRAPIPNARVLPGDGSDSSVGVATDSQGSATLAQREPGGLELQVRARGYESVRVSVDARAGESTELGTIALEKEITLAGRVLDGDGRPRAASFSLGIVDPLDRSIRWLSRGGFASRGNGSFEFRGLRRAEYVIRTRNHDAGDRGAWRGVPWVSADVLVDARGGSLADLEVRLSPASRLVLGAASLPAGALRYRILDEHGHELAEGRLRGSAPQPLDLPAGNCRILLFGEQGALLAEHAVTLGPEPIELGLPR